MVENIDQKARGRKRVAERIRNISELRASDKEGLIFQPEQESMRRCTRSTSPPSSYNHREVQPLARNSGTPRQTGFLASVLSSLLNLRIETKRLNKYQQGLCRYKFGLLNRLQECQVLPDPDSREDNGHLKGAAPADQGAGREYGLRSPAQHRGLPIGCW
jgi:hypothetical protein